MSTTNGLAVLAMLGPCTALVAYAEVYMSPQQATNVIFPGLKMEKTELTLTDMEASKIESLAGEKVRSKNLNIWKSANKDYVYIDQVLGKHEFITYAIGINKEGKVKGVEILEYRESYGGKIREDSWRKQFLDKDKSAKLKLDEDIRNISGATLSCSHITNGVKRILVTHDIVASKL